MEHNDIRGLCFRLKELIGVQLVVVGIMQALPIGSIARRSDVRWFFQRRSDPHNSVDPNVIRGIGENVAILRLDIIEMFVFWMDT